MKAAEAALVGAGLWTAIVVREWSHVSLECDLYCIIGTTVGPFFLWVRLLPYDSPNLESPCVALGQVAPVELVAIQEGDCQQERLGLSENVERALGGAWGLLWW